MNNERRSKTKPPGRFVPSNNAILEANLLKHDCRKVRYQRLMRFILENNLAAANIQFKDSVLYSSERECLLRYRTRVETKHWSAPLERFIVAAPRIHMQPECSRIGLYYKRLQSEHLKQLRRGKMSSSGADTCYETNRNSLYVKDEPDGVFIRIVKPKEPPPKHFSWADALRSPIFEYFSEIRSKPKHTKTELQKTKRKSSSSLSKKLRQPKPVKQNVQTDHPYYCHLTQPSPSIKKSKSCSKFLKRRPSEKIYTQASVESDREQSSGKKSTKSMLKSLGFKKKSNQYG